MFNYDDEDDSPFTDDTGAIGGSPGIPSTKRSSSSRVVKKTRSTSTVPDDPTVDQLDQMPGPFPMATPEASLSPTTTTQEISQATNYENVSGTGTPPGRSRGGLLGQHHITVQPPTPLPTPSTSFDPRAAFGVASMEAGPFSGQSSSEAPTPGRHQRAGSETIGELNLHNSTHIYDVQWRRVPYEMSCSQFCKVFDKAITMDLQIYYAVYLEAHVLVES